MHPNEPPFPPTLGETWEGIYQDDHCALQVGPEHLLKNPNDDLGDETVNKVIPEAYSGVGLVWNPDKGFPSSKEPLLKAT